MWKRDIKMRYIDTERQLANIFTKLLDASRFAALWGEIDVCHPHGLISGGGLCSILYILYRFAFLSHFLHVHLS
jgi:hypothetical protein